ncbi:hypothetical protein ABOM_005708 [Aspergillus bombycis]|uniref:Uncharacterized protein n=1 Tax=Aspergillus bombycis TaxID=109264 RepID=A0A1F8A2Z3_9EURO|nr:hypothetical protein ABOM_005708 [Aspergillus bombycis]OGM46057.1 hypothetical protein ABOM_005708 [Aspergillus bombycis]
MAPVLPRLSHTLPGYYPPIRGAPPIPISGPKTITLKAVLELFTGTFCIFVAAVLIWKLGNFFRRFTKEKIIGGGNSPARRYVKAWYGWVPLEPQKAKRSIMQKCFAKVRQWTTWNSAKNSYCSIWWNSQHTELEACKQDSMCQQRLRTHLKKHKPTTANGICSPCGYVFRSGQGAGSCSSPKMAGVLQLDKMVNTGVERYKLPRRRQRRKLSSAKELFKDDLQCVAPATRANQSTMVLNHCTIQAGRLSARSLNHKRFLSLDQSACALTGNDLVFYISNNGPLAKRNHSLPCLSDDLKITFRRVGKRSEASSNSQRPTRQERKARNLRALIYSRKYQVWSARMELNVPECEKYSKHRFPVPPGSPRPELLMGFSSHRTSLAKMINKDRSTAVWSSLSGSSGPSISSTQKRRVKRANVISYKAKATTAKTWQPATMLYRQDQCQLQTTHSISKHQNHIQFYRFQCPSTRLRKSIRSQGSDKEGRPQSKKANILGTTSAQITIPLRHLSNWEIILIDCLDRRLGWLSQQLMPGRRPFHFPLLPNHWLNIRTWVVYDPASRAPINVKRQFGDPRFSTPSPTSQHPKRKHPAVPRKVANTPRIESWRIAVNRHRRASGVRDLVKRVELYDGSADDPQDGYIDPACWLIRKPPQGNQLSARQNTTYYEGGAGWQEKLDDWQNIRRGYRIRKAIYEGKANRTRAKQVAVGLTRFYQRAWYRRQNQQT